MLYLVKPELIDSPRIRAMAKRNGDDPDTSIFGPEVRVDSWQAVQKRAPGNPWKHMSELYGTAQGKTVLIAGSGPSVRTLESVPEGWTVMAINRSWKACPRVDYWCLTDPSSLKENPDAPETMTKIVSIQLYSWLIGKPAYMVSFAGNPLRWPEGKRPLYWNETTLGWVIHLAIRMGAERIITIGTELSEEGQYDGYVQPHRNREWQKAQHFGVRERMLLMFKKDRDQWLERPVELLDASNGALPLPKVRIADAV
jgi:hypothetical protein